MPGSRVSVGEHGTRATDRGGGGERRGGVGAVAVRAEAAEVGVLRDWNQGPLTVGSARIKDIGKRRRAESESKVSRAGQRAPGGKG